MLGAEVCDATLSIMLVGYGGAAAMETGFYRYRYRIARSRMLVFVWLEWCTCG
jgi:hypothetical protein